MVPEKLRVSIGTAASLGLARCRLDVKPTTAYLMTFTDGKCVANCMFCPQARESQSEKSLLSRVNWPAFTFNKVLERLTLLEQGVFERVCIQAINYPNFFDDVYSISRKIRDVTELPVSLDAPPLNRRRMGLLIDSGVERICIPLDAATPQLFERVKGRLVKGPYRWETHLKALKDAVDVFGTSNVMSNLIIGLGETEEEAVGLIQSLMDTGVHTALFAFTPVPGTMLAHCSPPRLDAYRRVQMARYLICHGHSRFEEMEFDESDRLTSFGSRIETIKRAIQGGEAFRTSGCPGCNRPYYNERPTGPIFNYPRKLTSEEAYKEIKEMRLV